MTPTFDRYCIVCGHDMELVRRYRDGNELVSCRPCGRQEEISQTGYQVPGLQREAVKTQATADLMADILAGIPAITKERNPCQSSE